MMQFDHPIATPPHCEAHSTPRIEPAWDLLGPSSWALRFRWTANGIGQAAMRWRVSGADEAAVAVIAVHLCGLRRCHLHVGRQQHRATLTRAPFTVKRSIKAH